MGMNEEHALLIRGGILVDERGVREGSLLVSGGRIAGEYAVGQEAGSGVEVLEAEGMVVMPGCVDAHVHFGMGIGGGMASRGVEESTRASVHGGTTTVVDFTDVLEGADLVERLDRRAGDYAGRSHCDYGFHLTLGGGQLDLGSIRRLAEAGQRSFKVFTTYGDRGLKIEEAALLDLMGVLRDSGARLWVHCESDVLVTWATRSNPWQVDGPCGHGRRRPKWAEVEAVGRIVQYGAAVGCPVHIVHASVAASIEAVASARREGADVTVETCPHYLLWDMERLCGEKGVLFTMAPPLRDAAQVSGLWRSLQDGDVDIITTDSCGFPDDWKYAGASSGAVPMGIDGAGVMLPVLLVQGVGTGRLGLDRVVELCSRKPAELCGLYPRKGTLRVGADADIVMVLAPAGSTYGACGRVSGRGDMVPGGGDKGPGRWGIAAAPLGSPPLYVAEGMGGWPSYVVKGGEVVVAEGRWQGNRPRGRFFGETLQKRAN